MKIINNVKGIIKLGYGEINTAKEWRGYMGHLDTVTMGERCAIYALSMALAVGLMSTFPVMAAIEPVATGLYILLAVVFVGVLAFYYVCDVKRSDGTLALIVVMLNIIAVCLLLDITAYLLLGEIFATLLFLVVRHVQGRASNKPWYETY